MPAMGSMLDKLCFVESSQYASTIQMRKLSLREENMLPKTV